MKLMPFNFYRLNDGRVVISNIVGFHCFAESDESSLLTQSDSPSDNQAQDFLRAGCFIGFTNICFAK